MRSVKGGYESWGEYFRRALAYCVQLQRASGSGLEFVEMILGVSATAEKRGSVRDDRHGWQCLLSVTGEQAWWNMRPIHCMYGILGEEIFTLAREDVDTTLASEISCSAKQFCEDMYLFTGINEFKVGAEEDIFEMGAKYAPWRQRMIAWSLSEEMARQEREALMKDLDCVGTNTNSAEGLGL